MSGEKETLRRVQDGLFHLRKGIAPFVEGRMKAVHGANWQHYASRAVGSQPGEPLDAYGLLKTIIDSWRDVFDSAFGRNEKHKARNFTSVALEARNATSHLSIPLADEDALRYLDAMHQLLRLTRAQESEVAELKRLYEEQRRIGVEMAVDAKTAPQAPASTKLDLEPSDSARGALKPWVEVALPHPDVIANRFKESEFAADLFAVDSGNASEGYATPSAFFGITFLTEGLRRVLSGAMQRMAGTGGDPVIGLQTAFGGGKTHTMLSIYHLAQHLRDGGDPRSLSGCDALATAIGAKSWPKPKIAVFVGSAKGTDVSLNLKGGPPLRTLWGYIAWRLAGDEGLRLVAEAEAARTNPGSELMVEVFRLAGPSVILLDEVVAYARQLPEDRFEALLSFVQSLTEAAKMVPGILVVGSLPESDLEAGGEKGVQALRRLQHVFGRVHSTWLPASGDETYEIIRRRLFQPLDGEGEKAREDTVRAFHDMYRRNPAEFPPETKETRYLELLRLSYPIHPELFARLSRDWAGLEKFQRTRGVLRFMANIVGVLWAARAPDPLITLARVPVAHEKVRASVLYPLEPAFAAVVDGEVDGDGSLPTRVEANPTRRIAQARAATRAARSVFLCSAPSVGRPNAGLDGQGLRLACAEPGDQLALFREALHELTERATYLYEEAGRYWFSTQPTLNKLADERARSWPDHEVDAAIGGFLREDAAQRGGFARVFAAPDDPVAVDEADALSLLILAPRFMHSGKGTVASVATEAVADALTRCRGSQRRFRNTLVFVAADEASLDTAREVTRRSLAWRSIVDDKRLQQQMTQGQATDAAEKAKTQGDAARKAVRAAWSHILYPVRSDVAGKPFALEHSFISTRERPAIPAAVYEKVRAEGIASEKLGSENLWIAIKDLWPVDRPHLPLSEVAEWFSTYVYMPKIRDRVVLEAAIRDAVGKFDPRFGYADRLEPDGTTYGGLTWAKSPPELFPATALLVRAAEAEAQLAARLVTPKETPDSPQVGGDPGVASPGSPNPALGTGGVGRLVVPDAKPKRFFGTVDIDMVRPVKAFETVLNAVILELQRTPGAKVRVALEIEAEAPGGFAEDDVSVVRDNVRSLKFRPDSTGFGD
jgi:hypothetical protein